jgi:hypothetical protein
VAVAVAMPGCRRVTAKGHMEPLCMKKGGVR